jgi:hypothetical protein
MLRVKWREHGLSEVTVCVPLNIFDETAHGSNLLYRVAGNPAREWLLTATKSQAGADSGKRIVDFGKEQFCIFAADQIKPTEIIRQDSLRNFQLGSQHFPQASAYICMKALLIQGFTDSCRESRFYAPAR